MDDHFYYGNSMWGTFRPGDALRIEPVALDGIRRGDVVVYRKSNQPFSPLTGGDQGNHVVHRVIKIVPGGLFLRGDNNLAADIAVILEDDVIGRVTHVQRGDMLCPVQNGRRGAWRGHLLHARKTVLWWLLRIVTPVGRWPYRWLRGSGLARWIWRPTITEIHLQTERGPLVKFVCGSRTVAYWFPQENRYKCVTPYDLVLWHRFHPGEPPDPVQSPQ
ncbi:MAG: S24/S26 family peptidase [Anaerolineae bacterium]|nr:S24/S26 family peptidase [Anaerolineae bacterium]